METLPQIAISLPDIPQGSTNLAPPPLPPLNIRVLLWNINGSNAKGDAAARKHLVTGVVRNVNPDVILLQEVKYDTWIKEIINDYKEVRAKEKTESRILFKKGNFEYVSEKKFFLSTKKRPRSLLKTCIKTKVPVGEVTLRRKQITGWQRAFKDRICIAGLRRQGYNETIVFVSFHNVNVSDAIGRTSSEQFCGIVSEISNLTGCTVIAGADLNYRLPQRNHPTFTVLQYEPTERRQDRVIDHFIVAPPGITGDSSVEALNFVETSDGQRLHQLMQTLNREYPDEFDRYKAASDHDPILLDLTIHENEPEDET